jgi:hypothetical protein
MAAKKPAMRRIDPKPTPKKKRTTLDRKDRVLPYRPAKPGTPQVDRKDRVLPYRPNSGAPKIARKDTLLSSDKKSSIKKVEKMTKGKSKSSAPKKKDFFDTIGDAAGSVARGAWNASVPGTVSRIARSKQGRSVVGQAMELGTKYGALGLISRSSKGSSKSKGKSWQQSIASGLPGGKGKPAPKKPGSGKPFPKDVPPPKPGSVKPKPKPKGGATPMPKPRAPRGPLGPQGQKPYTDVPKGYKPNWNVPAGTPWKKDSPYNPANAPKATPKKPAPIPKKPKPMPNPKPVAPKPGPSGFGQASYLKKKK